MLPPDVPYTSQSGNRPAPHTGDRPLPARTQGRDPCLLESAMSAEAWVFTFAQVTHLDEGKVLGLSDNELLHRLLLVAVHANNVV